MTTTNAGEWIGSQSQPSLRQQVSRMLRERGGLGAAESVRSRVQRVRFARRNHRLRVADPTFVYPPTDLAYDAYGTADLSNHRVNGSYVAGFVWDLLARHADRPVESICEWGCGPGRVVRHLHDASGNPDLDVWGTDYNHDSITWCTRHLPDVHFAHNALHPPLPFADDRFDACFALSVFTHLSADLHSRWITELRRVVRPGGLVLITTHGDRFASKLMPDERARYDRGELVVRDNVHEGTRAFAAFHPHVYVRDHLLADTDIVSHLPTADPRVMSSQDAWLTRVQA